MHPKTESNAPQFGFTHRYSVVFLLLANGADPGIAEFGDGGKAAYDYLNEGAPNNVTTSLFVSKRELNLLQLLSKNCVSI